MAFHVQRVVLAFAGGDHSHAEISRELDKLDGRGGLVTGRPRIDDARSFRLTCKVPANGDVAFDVHHDDGLAAVDRLQRQVGPEIGIAGGIDDDVDQAARRKRHRVFDQGETPRFDQAIDGVAVMGEPGPLGVDSGDGSRLLGHPRIDFGDRAQSQPRHLLYLANNVGPHLPAAGKADSHGFAPIGASEKVGGKGRRHRGTPFIGKGIGSTKPRFSFIPA